VIEERTKEGGNSQTPFQCPPTVPIHEPGNALKTKKERGGKFSIYLLFSNFRSFGSKMEGKETPFLPPRRLSRGKKEKEKLLTLFRGVPPFPDGRKKKGKGREGRFYRCSHSDTVRRPAPGKERGRGFVLCRFSTLRRGEGGEGEKGSRAGLGVGCCELSGYPPGKGRKEGEGKRGGFLISGMASVFKSAPSLANREEGEGGGEEKEDLRMSRKCSPPGETPRPKEKKEKEGRLFCPSSCRSGCR